jgi:hypothetical protein
MTVSTYPDVQAWQRDRIRFNHDWLMVSFLTFLQAWREDLDAAGGGAGLAPEAALHLQQWVQHRDGLLNLLAVAEWALGPLGQQHASADDDAPLSAHDTLLSHAHAVWCERSGIGARLAELRAVASEADELVWRLLQHLPVQEAGSALYRLCLQVSRGLSGLPSAGYLA